MTITSWAGKAPAVIAIAVATLAVIALTGGTSGNTAETDAACCVTQPLLPAPAPLAPGEPEPLITPISRHPSPTMSPPVTQALVISPPVTPALATRALIIQPTTGAAMPVARGSYTIKKGARLFVVAQRTGTSFADLLLLNPALAIDRKLPAGTLVLLPISGQW